MKAQSDSADTPVVHIVEDDESSGLATARVMRVAGLAVRLYQSASRFMEQSPTGPGCIILDLNLPGPSGLELQERLTQMEDPLPIVFLTGHGNIPKKRSDRKRWSAFARILYAVRALVGAESHWYEAVHHVAQQHGWAAAY